VDGRRLPQGTEMPFLYGLLAKEGEMERLLGLE
jgi:hypothetical protein